MVDITLCTNAECSKAKTCYRFLAKPSSYYQSYFSEMTEELCNNEHYWEIDPKELEETNE